MAETPYDRIAQWYDVDMARNMRFDDVAFYADLCRREGGRTLELGCGNGRILLALMRLGIDIVGVDTSRRMLQHLQQKAGQVEPRVCQMDARKLAFARNFTVVLCPYSLVTYMSRPGDLEQMLSEIRRALLDGGLLVLDAFVPRDTGASRDYTLDYRRALGDAVLARYKRVAPIAPHINRIERRYEVVSAEGAITETLETCEDIRAFAPDELSEAMLRCGFAQHRTWWDYGKGARDANPQFFTVAARLAAGG